MRKSACVLSLILIAWCSQIQAEEVKIKFSFWSDWQYSVDGRSYRKLGTTGSKLHNLMEGNEEAQQHMRTFRTHRTVAVVLGYPGGALVGFSLGAAMWGEWNDDYGTVCLVGASLCVAATVFELFAAHQLKEGVRIYNEGQQALDLNVGYGKSLASDDGQLRLALNWRF